MDKVVIIGAGKIASSVVNAFIRNKIKISCIVSRNINSAKALAAKSRGTFYTDKLSDITLESNVFILSVPDSQIKGTAKKLSLLKFDFRNSIFIHLSGAMDITELESLKKKKASTASLHIMQSFPSKKIVGIENCFTAIESSSKKAENYLIKISKRLGLTAIKVNSEYKSLYHLAGVFASNFLIANLFSAEKLLKKASPSRVSAPEIMRPIIKTTLNNIDELGVAGALSGPIDRGDLSTVKKHIKGLKRLKDKTILTNYICQSILLLKVSEEKYGRLNDSQLSINDLLKAELNRLL